ncbi:MAG: hypothetical protein P4N60_19710 [Verrucomicrobiae bacterium]|nr:hypothetical protein [Verrucomicrobiae bacterium]
MADFSSWFDHFIQTLGIVFGLLLNALATNRQAKASDSEAKAREREAKSREIENILTLADHHRNLWGEISEHPELSRVFDESADAVKNPPTVLDEVFINKAFTQYLTGWRIVKAGGMTTKEELEDDMRWFFSLPLPRAVWEKNKVFKNQEFVEFVERALN